MTDVTVPSSQLPEGCWYLEFELPAFRSARPQLLLFVTAALPNEHALSLLGDYAGSELLVVFPT